MKEDDLKKCVMKTNVGNKMVIVLAAILFLCMPMLSAASAMSLKGSTEGSQKIGVDVLQAAAGTSLQFQSDKGNLKNNQSSNTGHFPAVVWLFSAGGVLIGLVEIRRERMSERRPFRGRDRLEVISKEAVAENAWQARREKGIASSVA